MKAEISIAFQNKKIKYILLKQFVLVVYRQLNNHNTKYYYCGIFFHLTCFRAALGISVEPVVPGSY